jgi:hypothetical protein
VLRSDPSITDCRAISVFQLRASLQRGEEMAATLDEARPGMHRNMIKMRNSENHSVPIHHSCQSP